MTELLLLSEASASQIPVEGEGVNTMAETIANIGTGVSGLLQNVVGPGLNFIVTNEVTLLMMCLSFTGAAFGFARRAFKTARG